MEHEAEAMEDRNGIMERRTVVNGRAWDTFWKVLSVLVVPWAFAMTALVWDLSKQTAKMSETIALTHQAYDRRLVLLEKATDPMTRMYRWDGVALGDRIKELESLHRRSQ